MTANRTKETKSFPLFMLIIKLVVIFYTVKVLPPTF